MHPMLQCLGAVCIYFVRIEIPCTPLQLRQKGIFSFFASEIKSCRQRIACILLSKVLLQRNDRFFFIILLFPCRIKTISWFSVKRLAGVYLPLWPHSEARIILVSCASTKTNVACNKFATKEKLCTPNNCTGYLLRAKRILALNSILVQL